MKMLLPAVSVLRWTTCALRSQSTPSDTGSRASPPTEAMPKQGDYYPTERALEQSAVALRDMLIEFSRVQARLSCPSSSRIGLGS